VVGIAREKPAIAVAASIELSRLNSHIAAIGKREAMVIRPSRHP
jgi:hypothetical protein